MDVEGVMDALAEGGELADTLTELLLHSGPDPLGMMLTGPEIRRAYVIKQAVELDEANNDIHNLSDFEYVQYALTCEPEESLEFIVRKRIFTLQCFKEEYKVKESLEEGVTVFHQLTLTLPGLILALEKDQPNGNYVCIQDWSKLLISRVKSPDKLREFLVGHYYLYHAWNPDFRAMRLGVRNVFECEGTTFVNYDQTFFEVFMEHLYIGYPLKHQVQHFLHTPSVVNIVVGLCKRFFSPAFMDTLHIGEDLEGFDGQRIDVFFNVPTPELARQKLVQNVETSLRLRQQNQLSFCLPPPP